MKSWLKAIVVLALAVSVSGCFTPLNRGAAKVLALGVDNPDSMEYRNISVVVTHEEVSLPKYSQREKVMIHAQGVDLGSEQALYRVAISRALNPERFLYKGAGSVGITPPAMVPDHIPRLRYGDIIEIRQRGTWDLLTNFLEKEEGNTVLRILCRAGLPEQADCILNDVPHITKWHGFGPTGTPYPESLKEYGFSFTPFYDKEGNPIREYPTLD